MSEKVWEWFHCRTKLESRAERVVFAHTAGFWLQRENLKHKFSIIGLIFR